MSIKGPTDNRAASLIPHMCAWYTGISLSAYVHTNPSLGGQWLCKMLSSSGGWIKGVWELSELSLQFFCKSKIKRDLKNK